LPPSREGIPYLDGCLVPCPPSHEVGAREQPLTWSSSYDPCEDDIVVFPGRSRLVGPGRRVCGLSTVSSNEDRREPLSLLEPEPFELQSKPRYFDTDGLLAKKVRFSDVVTVLELPPAVDRGVSVTRLVEVSERRRAARRDMIRKGLLSPPSNPLSSLREQSELGGSLDLLFNDLSTRDKCKETDRRERLDSKPDCNTTSSPLGSPAHLPLCTVGALDAATKARRCVGCGSVFPCGRRSKSTHCPACRGEDGSTLDPNPLHPARIRRASDSEASLASPPAHGYPGVGGGGGYGPA